MAERVLISGASGFIASHTIEQLLEAGYEVVGTVRDPLNTEKVGHLNNFPGAKERLTLVAADLNADNPFDEYVSDVDYVLHTASPYILNVRDAQKHLVDPAVRGTTSMLNACLGQERIKRVIVTSSVAAITDEPQPGQVLSEENWNEKSDLQRNPYYYSKTMAEKAAWALFEEKKPNWGLATVNPFLVVGPSFSSDLNESNKVFADIINGQFPAIMGLTWGIVDVRDVAKAHVLAMTGEKASGRYLCAAELISMRDSVQLLRENGYADRKLPKAGMDSSFGNKIGWLASFAQPSGVGSYLRSHLGRVPNFDNSKIKKELGMEFRSVPESIIDACKDMQKWGHIPG